jgi:metallophosphoesterase superfamily enzyme
VGNQNRFLFISKTLFFPKEGILVIGDLHLGYNLMLENQGFFFHSSVRRNKKELESIIKK